MSLGFAFCASLLLLCLLTGMMLRITRFGFMTPMEAMPTPDFAVPYAAPMSNRMGGFVRWINNQARRSN
jgi:hypothetical protein